MVSIRRRRLIAASTGRNIFIGQISKLHSQQRRSDPLLQCTFSVVEGTETSSKENLNFFSKFSSPNCSEAENGSHVSITEPEVKKRNPQRRKVNNQDLCTLRGVYYKNMKWQAAIKVGKKQVHLGTVSCKEEAAHLYDRAAYMCGREPNFELSADVRKELDALQWEDFLALTRREIANKKLQKRLEAQNRRNQTAVCKFSVQSLIPNDAFQQQ